MKPTGTLARMSKFPWLVGLAACTSAGATRGAETAEPIPTAPTADVAPAAPSAAEPPPTPPPAAPPPAHPTLEALLPELASSPAERVGVLSSALERCPAPRGTGDDALSIYYDECRIGSTFGRERDAWVVLEVSHSEGGVERLRLARVTPTTSEVLFEDEPSPEATAALRTRLRDHRRAARPNELVRERATASFSLDEYAPLVGLGAPLERWLLFVETTNDLDRPEHVLHLIARDGSARHELARRPAPLGPCDGGGYYCERTQDECDEDGLRAEGRLCIQPASIAHVAVADGTLALLGSVHVAGHGGYPATSWVVALPPGL
jgi:hypothetical protein